MKTVLIFSGGVDSTTLLYWLLSKNKEVHTLTFDYGQRHRKEIDAAKLIAKKLGISNKLVDISPVKTLLKSALTGSSAVPYGHYADEVMKQTVVPMRNTIMLSIAVGYAESIGAEKVVIGAHGGDHPIYLDCRPAFFKAFDEMVKSQELAIDVVAPFSNLDKTDIVRLGLGLGVPYDLTWSCYEGGEKPCGKCGTCIERIEAFSANDA